MRNLKRVLSLALATVMLLGMMAMSASAASVSDFTDADQISNKEAAAITTAIGIFSGYGDGTFRPSNIVTRAEMATIICKMLYGADVDGANFSGVNVFSDVTKSWQIGYVNLCSSLGIVSGYGDGTFHPEQTVTTAEAAVMLCKALGYFKNDAEYGNSWELAAISKATQLGMFGELRLSSNAGLTRDSVAVMAFNTLANAVPVDYNSTFDSYYPQGQSWTTGVYPYSEMVKGDHQEETLGYRNLRLVRSITSGGADEYGRPAVTWGTGTIYTSTGSTNVTIKEKILDATDTPIATYTGAQRSVNLTGYTFHETSSASDVEVWENGVEDKTNNPDSADDVKDLTGNDKVVEVYANDKKEITKIVVVRTDVAKVTSVSNTKKTVNLTVDGAGSYTIGEKDPFFNDIYGNVAVDDRVMIIGYQKDGKNLLRDAYLPEVVTGTVTYVNTDTDGNSAIVNGVTYTAADKKTFNRNMVNTTRTLYIDRNGKVRDTDSATTYTNQYMFLTNLWQKTIEVDNVPTNNAKVFARGVLEDGTVTTIEVANTIGLSGGDYGVTVGKKYAFAIKDGDLLYLHTTQTPYGQIVELKDDSDGKTYLTVPQSTVNGTTDKSGVAAHLGAVDSGARALTIGGKDIYIAEDAKVVYVHGNDDGTIINAQAVDEVQAIGLNKIKGVVENTVNGQVLITTIFVDEAYTTSVDLIYVSGTYKGTESYINANGKETKGWRYKAFINGQEQEIIACSDAHKTGYYTSVPDGGAYRLTAYADNVVYGVVTGAYRNGITVNGADYLLDNAEITDTTDNGLTTFAAIQSEFNNNNTLYVHLYYNVVNNQKQVVGMSVDSNKETAGGVVTPSTADADKLSSNPASGTAGNAVKTQTATVTEQKDTTVVISGYINNKTQHTGVERSDQTTMGDITADGTDSKPEFVIVKVTLPATGGGKVAVKQTNGALSKYYSADSFVGKTAATKNIKFKTWDSWTGTTEFYLMVLAGQTATLEVDYNYQGADVKSSWDGTIPEKFETDFTITVDGTGIQIVKS